MGLKDVFTRKSLDKTPRETLEKELAEKKNQVQQLLEQLENIKEKLQESEAEGEADRKKISELKQEIEELTEAGGDGGSMNADESLKVALAASESRERGLRQKVRDLNEELEETQDELQKANEGHGVRKFSSVKSEEDSAQSDDQENERLLAAEEKAEEMADRCADAERRLSEALEEQEELEERLQEALELLEEKKAEAEASRSSLAQQDDDRDAGATTEMEEELQRLREKLDEEKGRHAQEMESLEEKLALEVEALEDRHGEELLRAEEQLKEAHKLQLQEQEVMWKEKLAMVQQQQQGRRGSRTPVATPSSRGRRTSQAGVERTGEDAASEFDDESENFSMELQLPGIDIPSNATAGEKREKENGQLGWEAFEDENDGDGQEDEAGRNGEEEDEQKPATPASERREEEGAWEGEEGQGGDGDGELADEEEGEGPDGRREEGADGDRVGVAGSRAELAERLQAMFDEDTEESSNASGPVAPARPFPSQPLVASVAPPLSSSVLPPTDAASSLTPAASPPLSAPSPSVPHTFPSGHSAPAPYAPHASPPPPAVAPRSAHTNASVGGAPSAAFSLQQRQPRLQASAPRTSSRRGKPSPALPLGELIAQEDQRAERVEAAKAKLSNQKSQPKIPSLGKQHTWEVKMDEEEPPPKEADIVRSVYPLQRKHYDVHLRSSPRDAALVAQMAVKSRPAPEPQLVETVHGLTTRHTPPPPRAKVSFRDKQQQPLAQSHVPWLPEWFPPEASPSATRKAPPQPDGGSPSNSSPWREDPSPARGRRRIEPGPGAVGAAGSPTTHVTIHDERANKQVYNIPANRIYFQDKGEGHRGKRQHGGGSNQESSAVAQSPSATVSGKRLAPAQRNWQPPPFGVDGIPPQPGER